MLLEVALAWCLAPLRTCRVTSAQFPSAWLRVLPPRTARSSVLPAALRVSTLWCLPCSTGGWILPRGQSCHLIHAQSSAAPQLPPREKLITESLEFPTPCATDPSCQTHRLNVNKLSIIDINTGNAELGHTCLLGHSAPQVRVIL